jgi:hypothetical protein
MCYRVKIFPIRDIEVLAEEDIRLFEESELFNKANGKIISSAISCVPFDYVDGWRARINFMYNASYLTEDERERLCN